MADPRTIIISLTVPITASATTYGAAQPGFDRYDALKGVLQIPGGLSATTLNLYLQHSWDGGTTWSDCAAFAQLAAGAVAVNYDFSIVLDSTIRTVAVGTASLAAPVLTPPAIVSGPWGGLLRLVAVSGAATSTGTVAITCRLFSWQGPHV